MPEELTLLPCPLCQATAHVEYHNGYLRVICEGEPGCPFRMGGKRFVFIDECYDWWNNLPRALEWTTEPQLGAWNWWRDENSRIPRYVYQDGTVDIAMQIDRVPYQKLGGQWAGPIPEPREPKE